MRRSVWSIPWCPYPRISASPHRHRWYRAPEILVGWKRYTAAVDVWAVGTILGELLNRRPMLPGVDSIHQMDLIIDMFGKPDEAFIQECRKPSFRQQLRESDDTPAAHLSCRYPKASAAAIDFMYRVMELHPDARLSAAQALEHGFVSGFKSPFVDASFHCQTPLPPLPSAEFAFERLKNTSSSLRAELLREGTDCRCGRIAPVVLILYVSLCTASEALPPRGAPTNRHSSARWSYFLYMFPLYSFTIYYIVSSPVTALMAAMKTIDSTQTIEEGDNGSNSAADSQRISSGVTFETGGGTREEGYSAALNPADGSYLETASAAEGSGRPPLYPSGPVKLEDSGVLPSDVRDKENVIHKPMPTRPLGILGRKCNRLEGKRKECEMERDGDSPLVKRRSSSADCVEYEAEAPAMRGGGRTEQSFVDVVSHPVMVTH